MPSTELKRICAWCKKDIETGQQLSGEEYIAVNPTATHGMCRECEAKHFPIPLPDGHKIPEKSFESPVGLSGGGISDWFEGEQGEQYV